MHVLIELTPLDPVAGTRTTLRLSSAQDRTIADLNGVRWWPGIIRKPSLSMSLFDGDFSSSIDVGQASLELSLTALEKLNSNARRFVWAGASITIYAGTSGQAWPWTTVFAGKVKTFRAAASRLSVVATVDDEPFSVQVPSATYAGTGGLEGGADIKGKPKPWAFGAPKNVEPVLIDSLNSVFQVSAYGSGIKAVTALYERGAPFSASFGNYADYAALVAANIPAGRWATCLASGLIRLGAPPYGLITADIEGDYNGSVWTRLPGAILQRIATALSISSGVIDSTSLGAIDTYAATLPAGGNISLYLTEQLTFLDLAQKLALTFNAQAGISWTGKLFMTRAAIGSPVATLDSQQKRLPRVTDCIEADVSPPYTKIQMGAQKCWRVHTFDEIAFGAELIDKGLYSASVVYRDGNIVSLDDGSRWLFVGATPVAGSAPTDVNTNWARMTNAVQSAAIAAAQAAADAAQADADAALTTLTNIASDSLLTPDEKPRVIQDRDAIVAEQAGIDAQASAFSITTEKTTYDTAVSALTTYLATLTSPVLWSNLTGNTTIVGATFRQKFLDVYAARQALLNKIAAEAAKRADWSQLNGVPYDEIFNSDDDVTLGFNPVFAAWSGLYPDNWSNWTGGAPTKETSIVRVGSNAVRMTASGSDRGIQCDAISFTSTPFPVGTFLSGAVDFYLAARTSGLPGILVRLYTNSARTTFVDTTVQPGTTTVAWQRVPWTARVGSTQQIYGIRIYAMASWTAFPSGSFTGDVIFGDIRFGLFDSSTDNKAVAIAADGTLSGAGGGQVTITGLGYSGDLNATNGAPVGTLVAGVSASTVATATTNFNASNDRNSAAVAAPTVATDGTAVDHTLQSNGSADISFEWSWGGAEGDIDGFLVYLYQSSSSAAYSFGTTPAAETVFTLPASKRAFILFGTAPDQYYSFAVQAYRSVDKDINAAGAIKSTLVKATGSGENPYRPSASVAFGGNVTGTVNGIAAANVNVWSQISGTGKPADNATVGAPAGTNVGGTAATTVESGANAANAGVNSDGTIKNDKVITNSMVDESATMQRSAFSASNNAVVTVTLTKPASIAMIGSVSCPRTGFNQFLAINGVNVRTESVIGGSIPAMLYRTDLGAGTYDFQCYSTDNVQGFNATIILLASYK
ncbi:hypothetical protein OOT33_13690 [Sphingobium sp. DEHP117]|uniref:DUF7359 domain-containing protein n=1 Tax=Sphingobium sp. DEHP117 TaxID=2993436 RepID=UPI0027D6067C|nr:hypothetical protein [Sphingobium sp. DEHP117]MDQ4421475.1 hypothetical protein [Sphingobium sp. DEHP117]